MGEAFLGFLAAFPKAIDLGKEIVDAVKELGGAIREHAKVVQDQKLQEVRNAQNDLERRIDQVEDDQQRAALAKLRDEIRRGILPR